MFATFTTNIKCQGQRHSRDVHLTEEVSPCYRRLSPNPWGRDTSTSLDLPRIHGMEDRSNPRISTRGAAIEFLPRDTSQQHAGKDRSRVGLLGCAMNKRRHKVLAKLCHGPPPMAILPQSRRVPREIATSALVQGYYSNPSYILVRAETRQELPLYDRVGLRHVNAPKILLRA
jgi:hypothetical protein